MVDYISHHLQAVSTYLIECILSRMPVYSGRIGSAVLKVDNIQCRYPQLKKRPMVIHDLLITFTEVSLVIHFRSH